MNYEIKVYTDGACKNNGKINAIAGYGVYFANDNNINISKKLQGEQTNNRAELTAIYEALQILYKSEYLTKKIIIFTDSKYCYNCLTIWNIIWQKNNWKTKDKKNVKNRDLIENILHYLKLFPNLKLQHINSHTGLTDEDSLGNEQADILANKCLD
jgi:ribonuclease HI